MPALTFSVASFMQLLNISSSLSLLNASRALCCSSAPACALCGAGFGNGLDLRDFRTASARDALALAFSAASSLGQKDLGSRGEHVLVGDASASSSIYSHEMSRKFTIKQANYSAEYARGTYLRILCGYSERSELCASLLVAASQASEAVESNPAGQRLRGGDQQLETDTDTRIREGRVRG